MKMRGGSWGPDERTLRSLVPGLAFLSEECGSMASAASQNPLVTFVHLHGY